MGDVLVKKMLSQRRIRSCLESLQSSKCSFTSKLALNYLLLSLLSVPAKPGIRDNRASPQRLKPRRRNLSVPAAKQSVLTNLKVRAFFCRAVRHLTGKIRHQKNSVSTSESSEICTDRTLVKDMALEPQPPETWANSWTCWTSEMLEDKEQSLDWEMTPISTTTSDISLRSHQKTSGQFNEWTDTDLDLGNLKPMEKDILSFPDMELSQMLDTSIPDEDFLTSFMDLTEYLQGPEQPIEVTENVPNVISFGDDITTVEPLLLAESIKQEQTTHEEEFSVSVKREIDDLPDHDYVAKKPRLSPPTVSVDKTDKPSKSTTNKPPDQKYRERRTKNNIASRRSREIRKMKFVEMEAEAERLTVVNKELKIKIAEMEKVAKDMKALLVKRLAKK